MKPLAITPLIALLGATTASPAPAGIQSTVTLATTAPHPTSSSLVLNGIVYDATVSQYNVWTGEIKYNTRNGKIFKNGRQPDITTLMNFWLPNSAAGKDCTFRLRLRNDGTVSDTKKFDVFTSLHPAMRSAPSYPPGNQRDRYIGRMAIGTRPGVSTWVDPTVNSGKFKCPTGLFGLELVGVGDSDWIEWDDYYFTAGGEVLVL